MPQTEDRGFVEDESLRANLHHAAEEGLSVGEPWPMTVFGEDGEAEERLLATSQRAFGDGQRHAALGEREPGAGGGHRRRRHGNAGVCEGGVATR